MKRWSWKKSSNKEDMPKNWRGKFKKETWSEPRKIGAKLRRKLSSRGQIQQVERVHNIFNPLQTWATKTYWTQATLIRTQTSTLFIQMTRPFTSTKISRNKFRKRPRPTQSHSTLQSLSRISLTSRPEAESMRTELTLSSRETVTCWHKEGTSNRSWCTREKMTKPTWRKRCLSKSMKNRGRKT